MSSAILPHTLAAFAVGSTLVQPATHRQQEELRTGGMERNEARPPVSNVVVYVPRGQKYLEV